jgi:hypothetical protein
LAKAIDILCGLRSGNDGDPKQSFNGGGQDAPYAPSLIIRPRPLCHIKNLYLTNRSCLCNENKKEVGGVMDFADQIRELAARLDANKEHVFTEEATKQSLVMPFLEVLGYDVFDPTEVIPEFTADIGIKKGEKVDYVIAFDKEPKILIEVKTVRNILQPLAANQLLRYFGVTKASFGILTNGIQYQFFSDLEKKNVMDTTPFLVIDILPSIRDQEITELKRFHKNYFNDQEIISIAKELKYAGEIKRYLKQQFKFPDESFIRLMIKNTSYPGIVTKQTVERFSAIFHNAFKQYLKETFADTLKDTIEKTGEVEKASSKETKNILCNRFWKQLLAFSKNKTSLHSNVSPGKEFWCGTGAGTSGLSYYYLIFQHQARVELYIDKGKYDINRKIFDRLMSAKEEIERTFGEPLMWDSKEGRRAFRIKKDLTLGGYLDEENWPKIQEEMVDAMIRLHNALNPRIQFLRK